MEKRFDTLRFEIFDPYEAKEPWAVEFNKRNWHSVKIFINDKELNALLVGLEDKEKGVLTPTNSANEYGHNGVYIVDQLESDYADSYGASVCCCADCGEEGCWGIRVKVRKNEHEVVWHDFEHEHMSYTYGGLEFHFERHAYDAEIRKLQQWAKQHKH